MVNVSSIFAADPTLDAADRELVSLSSKERPRPYLGMSSLGESCSRKLWFRFRWAKREEFDAETLKRFEDGHLGEDLIVKRLQRVPDLILTHTGASQLTYSDVGGHLKGHPDGIIEGILHAPKTKHIFEAKVCGEKKITELKKAKLELGEKKALRKWNPVYYAQAILYMFYEGLTRHYLVAATPGVRDWISVRTDSDPQMAKTLISKAERIINSQNAPERVSEDPAWFECRFCSFSDICHGIALPDRNCRTCSHSETGPNGTWHCTLKKEVLSEEAQALGCSYHCYIPSLVKGEIIGSTKTSVTYRMKDGKEWKDGV